MSDQTESLSHLVGNTDAQVWAREFAKRFDVGVGLDGSPAQIEEDDLLGWFANALAAGEGAGYRQGAKDATVRELSEILVRRFPHFAVVQLRDDFAMQAINVAVEYAIENWGLGHNQPTEVAPSVAVAKVLTDEGQTPAGETEASGVGFTVDYERHVSDLVSAVTPFAIALDGHPVVQHLSNGQSFYMTYKKQVFAARGLLRAQQQLPQAYTYRVRPATDSRS